MSTKTIDLLPELEAGIFLGKIDRALSDGALATAVTGKESKIVVEIKMKRIGESNQVAMTHTLRYAKPTERGKVVEDNTTQTPLHVGRGGKLTIYPEKQEELFPKAQAAS